MKISGVVVLYKPDIKVKENILSYINELDKLYVIDNTPNGNNGKYFSEVEKIQYINNNENLGIAVALNLAAELSRNEKFEWLLTMDQDSKFEPDELKKLIQFVKNNKDERIGIISPWHKTKCNDKKPEQDIEKVMEVMTSGNLLNLNIHKNVGGFKEWLFIDSVDIEYGMNLNKNNYKVIRLNYVNLEHELGDIKVIKIFGRNFVCSNHNYIRRYYISRNINYVYSMYYNYFPEYCNFIKNGLKGATRNILFFEKDKYKKIRNIYRGIRDCKKGVTGKYPYND